MNKRLHYALINQIGEIVSTGECARNAIALNAPSDSSIILIEHDGSISFHLSYWDTDLESWQQRPNQKPEINGVSISNIEQSAELTLISQNETYGPYIITDGIAELSIIEAGKYTVSLKLWPFLDWEGDIHAD